MEINTQVAEQFGQLVAKDNFGAAHELLTQETQKLHSPTELQKAFEQMTAYAPGPVRQVEIMEDFILDDWPDKQDGDIA